MGGKVLACSALGGIHGLGKSFQISVLKFAGCTEYYYKCTKCCSIAVDNAYVSVKSVDLHQRQNNSYIICNTGRQP